MSKARKQQVRCPKCNRYYEVTVWESVNTDLYSGVQFDIISGKFFSEKCPHCNFVSNMEYDVLYHDMKRRAMIWVVHPGEEGYDKKVSEIREFDILKHPYTRIVSSMSELKEKISALEAGRDDRYIELAKVFVTHEVANQQPDAGFDNPYYSFVDGTESISLTNKNNQGAIVTVDDENLTPIIEVYKKYVEPFPNSEYPIYDYKWAKDISFLPFAHSEENNFVDGEQDSLKDEKSNNSEKVRVKVKVKRKTQNTAMSNSELKNTSITKECHTTIDRSNILFCHKCGNRLSEDGFFCNKCGTKIPIF